MDTYIALLRGINVGGRHIVPMKELRALLAEAGFENIRTYIQSGNIVFTGIENPVDAIGPLIQSKFGFCPEVVVLLKREFVSSAANNPFKEFEGKFVHFYFCKESPKPDFVRFADLAEVSDNYQLVEKTFYLHAPDGIGRSKLAANAEACLGVAATCRNLNTVNKLWDMLRDE